MQAGLEYSRQARAISTAIGYNQLLTTNSVELVAEQGREFVRALTEKAAQLSGAQRAAMEHKIAVLKKMVAVARSVPDEWAQHEKLGDTPQGWAIHAMVLDIDVGPMLQTHKLLTSVIFARDKGYTKPLTAAELEMMNLTGDFDRARHGDDAAGAARAGPDLEFFPALGLRAQSGGDPPQHRGQAARDYRFKDGQQQPLARREGIGGGVLVCRRHPSRLASARTSG